MPGEWRNLTSAHEALSIVDDEKRQGQRRVVDALAAHFERARAREEAITSRDMAASSTTDGFFRAVGKLAQHSMEQLLPLPLDKKQVRNKECFRLRLGGRDRDSEPERLRLRDFFSHHHKPHPPF